MKINPIHVPKREQNRCSICGSNIVNGVCAVCGWVQIIFPNQVPLEISDFDTQRKEIARNLYKGACTSKKETEELRRTIDAEVSKSKTLEDCLKEEKAKTRVVEQEKERLRDQVDKATKELASLKDVNQRMVKDAQRMISQIQSLEEERDRANEDVKVLRTEITKLKGILDTNQSNLSDLKGIVIISDITNLNSSDMLANAFMPINRQCLPVLSGINTYGIANSEEHHYQISIKHRGDVFLPKHFAVYTNHSKGLVIKDLSNGRITLNGNPFKEEYAGNSKFIIKQGRQIFTVEIKMFNL